MDFIYLCFTLATLGTQRSLSTYLLLRNVNEFILKSNFVMDVNHVHHVIRALKKEDSASGKDFFWPLEND